MDYYFIDRIHRCGTQVLLWGARGAFLTAAAMVVMIVAVGLWSLGSYISLTYEGILEI
jgi:hypothetical protein